MPGVRVLVVEPDESVRALIRKALEPLGYPVSATGDPDEAHALIHQLKDVGVVLSAFELPGVNGIEFFEVVRDSVPNVCGALVSSMVQDPQIQVKAEALGMAWLQKPFSVPVLVRLVRRLAARDRSTGSSG